MSSLHLLNVGEVPATDRVTHELFAAAVSSTRMSMVISDPNLPDCPVIYCNRAFLDLSGFKEEEVVGRNCRFLQGRNTDKAVVRRIRDALAERQDVHEELINYRRDGSYFWNALQVNAIVDEQERLRYFFASQQDVTQKREAIFRQGQRMESLGALASGIAHEVNNLLTVVIGSIEGAAGRTADQRQLQQLQRADWAARRTGELAKALLAMAQRQAADASPTDLNHAINELQGTFTQSTTQPVTITLDLADQPVVTRLDAVQFDLVLLNLIKNAAEAMPAGGPIVVRTRILPPTEAMDVLGSHDAVELAVVDQGAGMPAEIARRATEAFFTTKDRQVASGLGLFVALNFAEQAGGRLVVDTEPDNGTTVRVVLPREGASSLPG